MWIEVEAEGEYLNADMIETRHCGGHDPDAHMPSGESIVISTHRTTEEGVDALTTLMRMVGNPLE